MKSSSGLPALLASPARLSRFGPTVPLVPAAARVWQLPQPALPVKTVLPLAAFPVAPPPVEPDGVDVGGADDAGGADETAAVESGSEPRPTLDAPLVVVPLATMTTIITA